MSSPKVPSLRDHLVASLATLPNSSELQLYTITSHPRKTKDLFPHLPNHPRCLQVDYLVLCGAGVSPSASTPALAPGVSDTANQANISTNEEETPKPKPAPSFVFTSAISAHLYILPSSASALLYISKVDSSTHGPILPLTRTLISAFMTYHLLPSSRPAPETRICLFARSQGQYLFPNSADGGKKALGGLKLCGWWKGVYEDVARQALAWTSPQVPQGQQEQQVSTHGEGQGGQLFNADMLGSIQLEYLLPSYSSIEAFGMLGPPKKPLPKGLSWNYTPPFFTSLLGTSTSSSPSSSSITPPAANGKTMISLASLIPSLPDDPKTRFLDELVDSEPYHGIPAQGQDDDDHEDDGANVLLSPRKKRKMQEMKSDGHERTHAFGVLSNTTKEEFWERMGFRQEMAIDITGFFGLRVSTRSDASTSVTGNETNGAESQKPMADPGSMPGAISHQLVDRLQQALLNTDFKTLELAIQGSAHWIATAKTMVMDEIGDQGWERDIGIIRAKEGLVPLEKTEKRKEEAPVTMLQVRKKKKV